MNIQIILLLIAAFILFGGLVFGFVFCFLIVWNHARLDKSIIIDKGGRFTLIYQNLKNKEGFNFEKGYYKIDQDANSKNEKGKLLTIHYFNRPEQLRIVPNKMEWLSSENVNQVMTSDMVKDLVTPKSALKDLLMIVATICSLLGCVLALIIFLKVFGVIK